jgi:GNAT superfamily N-acetyltransferase
LRIRPMTYDDVDAAYLMSSLAFADTPEEREQVHRRSPEEVEHRKARFRRFVEHDPGGAWVAGEGTEVAGLAAALRREGVWVLSLLAVREEYQGRGIGGELLRRALEYAAGCRGGMIASSIHPGAMRSYARAGFDLVPALKAGGKVRRSALPAGLRVREGGVDDLELAARVGRRLRGAAHGPDLEVLVEGTSRFLVAENSAEDLGFAVEREGSPWLLGATRPETAAELLWACLAGAGEEEVGVQWITAAQQWAVPVVLEAGLSLETFGPLCFRGELGPLTPYLPSGPYL